MKSSATETRYTYTTRSGFQVRFTAGYRRGQTATGTLVEVHNHENGNTYTTRFLDGARPTCSCPHYQWRLKHTNQVCRHIDGAKAHLMAEAFPAEVSPAIVEQVNAPAFAAEVTPLLCDLARRLGRNPTRAEAQTEARSSYARERAIFTEALTRAQR